MVTKEQINEWLNSDRAQDCSHMLVVCDSFDYSDYPVYVKRTEDIQSKLKMYMGNMQKIMEVYCFDLDLKMQLSEVRSWNL